MTTKASNSRSSAGPARVVLDGVPRVGFYPQMQQHADARCRCPEDVPFPSCLRACLEYLGDGVGCRQTGLCDPAWRIGCGYAFLMGTTGAAFRLLWAPGWEGDNQASYLVSDDPSEVFHRGLASVGYECEVVCRADLRKQRRDTEKQLRDRIVHSIRDLRRPVIAHGVIGPPEECIITGYDEGGKVLIGWNFFQGFPDLADPVEFEPCGYFRKRDWFSQTHGLVLIGERKDRPALKDAYREALAFALEVVRRPARHDGRANGLAAYDFWAGHLLRDEEFVAHDQAALRRRHTAHDDAVGTVAEGRWYASLFLAEAAREMAPAAEHLLTAAAHYAAEHALMWKIWDAVGGIGQGDDKALKFSQPATRRQIVSLIHQARDHDARAAECIDKALKV
jgi:hypothetical protein